MLAIFHAKAHMSGGVEGHRWPGIGIIVQARSLQGARDWEHVLTKMTSLR